MDSTLTTQKDAPARPAEDVSPSAGPGRILVEALETFEQAGVPYCLLHGYEDSPQRVGSDVDCIVAAEPRRLVALLHEERARIGAEVVLWRDGYIVLAGKGLDGQPCFLK